jgi:hypothetical protein
MLLGPLKGSQFISMGSFNHVHLDAPMLLSKLYQHIWFHFDSIVHIVHVFLLWSHVARFSLRPLTLGGGPLR